MAKSLIKTSLFVILLIVVAVAGYAFWQQSPLATQVPITVAQATQAVVKPSYVGAAACAQCHSRQYKQWQSSDHAKAMQVASAKTVLGDFTNVSVEFHGIKTRFYQRDKQFLIDTLGNDKVQTFKVNYTFGYYPLQQYLIELADGHIQAFDVAWDSRPKAEGGQRWFHLQPDEQINSEHPFFWTKHFQNWNSRCANCHSTDLRLSYNAKSHSYNTQWSEINVACEACHGPASEHLILAGSENYSADTSGFAITLKSTHQFVFNATDTIAKNLGSQNKQQLHSCAGCHSRRAVIAPIDVTKDYHDQFSLSTLDQGLYFSDGQINDEVFVYGSFLQSKMHSAGVSCSNCHDPHTSRLKLEGNGLCLQCHKPAAYDVPKHHRHQPKTKGAACVSCHMPERTYMQVDGRRDHSFSIPQPALAKRSGAPNACGLCHSDWPAQKVIDSYQHLFGTEPAQPWAEANAHARSLNVLALRSITALANDLSIGPIRRASLMRQAANFPAQVTLDALQLGLQDANPMVRSAAIESLAFLPQQQRVELLLPLVNDAAKVVRMAVANQLAGAVEQPTAVVQKLFNEYEQSQLLTQNQPGTQLNLGSFYHRQGNVVRAKQAYERALLIEPAFVPALVNLADIYRAESDDNKAKQYLNKALKIAPDSAAVHYSLGLLYVREKNLAQALGLFKTAANLPTAEPRYAYTYAIALESAGSLSKAIDALTTADKRWPNNPELLMALATYLDRVSNDAAILPVLSRLSRIMPGNPDVQGLVRKYTR